MKAFRLHSCLSIPLGTTYGHARQDAHRTGQILIEFEDVTTSKPHSQSLSELHYCNHNCQLLYVAMATNGCRMSTSKIGIASLNQLRRVVWRLFVPPFARSQVSDLTCICQVLLHNLLQEPRSSSSCPSSSTGGTVPWRLSGAHQD